MSPLVLEDTWHVARRSHPCDVCLGVITAGDRYRRQRNVFDGEAYTWKAHALCDAAYAKAHRDLELYDDEMPDTAEDIWPLIQAFFAALCAFGDAS